MFIQQPFDEFLKMEYEWKTEETLHVRMPVQDFFINSTGVIHGGIISTLADVATSNLIPANKDGVQQAVTVDLNTSFLKAATGTHLIAQAILEKEGRTLIHARCTIYNDNQDKVAVATAILCRKTSS